MSLLSVLALDHPGAPRAFPTVLAGSAGSRKRLFRLRPLGPPALRFVRRSTPRAAARTAVARAGVPAEALLPARIQQRRPAPRHPPATAPVRVLPWAEAPKRVCAHPSRSGIDDGLAPAVNRKPPGKAATVTQQPSSHRTHPVRALAPAHPSARALGGLLLTPRTPPRLGPSPLSTSVQPHRTCHVAHRRPPHPSSAHGHARARITDAAPRHVTHAHSIVRPPHGGRAVAAVRALPNDRGSNRGLARAPNHRRRSTAQTRPPCPNTAFKRTAARSAAAA